MLENGSLWFEDTYLIQSALERESSNTMKKTASSRPFPPSSDPLPRPKTSPSINLSPSTTTSSSSLVKMHAFHASQRTISPPSPEPFSKNKPKKETDQATPHQNEQGKHAHIPGKLDAGTPNHTTSSTSRNPCQKRVSKRF